MSEKRKLEWAFYKRWNTLSHSFDGDTTRSFNILPSLEIFYNSQGFIEFGGEIDNEWCKELSIYFEFLFLSFTLRFWWDFYIK